jgi:hypothetical protein
VTPLSIFLVTFDSFPKTQPFFFFWFVKVMLYETSSNYNTNKKMCMHVN